MHVGPEFTRPVTFTLLIVRAKEYVGPFLAFSIEDWNFEGQVINYALNNTS
jgi:hypothetical protein